MKNEKVFLRGANNNMHSLSAEQFLSQKCPVFLNDIFTRQHRDIFQEWPGCSLFYLYLLTLTLTHNGKAKTSPGKGRQRKNHPNKNCWKGWLPRWRNRRP